LRYEGEWHRNICGPAARKSEPRSRLSLARVSGCQPHPHPHQPLVVNQVEEVRMSASTHVARWLISIVINAASAQCGLRSRQKPQENPRQSDS
jgi:hypothetical protein